MLPEKSRGKSFLWWRIVKITGATNAEIWQVDSQKKLLDLLPPSSKWAKFAFGWGSALDPTGVAYSAPPDPLAGFKGAYF